MPYPAKMLVQTPPQTRWILDELARETGVSRSELVRLAIHYYSLYGPRDVVSVEIRERIAHAYPHLSVGPEGTRRGA